MIQHERKNQLLIQLAELKRSVTDLEAAIKLTGVSDALPEERYNTLLLKWRYEVANALGRMNKISQEISRTNMSTPLDNLQGVKK